MRKIFTPLLALIVTGTLISALSLSWYPVAQSDLKLAHWIYQQAAIENDIDILPEQTWILHEWFLQGPEQLQYWIVSPFMQTLPDHPATGYLNFEDSQRLLIPVFSSVTTPVIFLLALLSFWMFRSKPVWLNSLVLPLSVGVIWLFLSWYTVQARGWWLPVIPVWLMMVLVMPVLWLTKRHQSHIHYLRSDNTWLQTQVIKNYLDAEQFDDLIRLIKKQGFSREQHELIYELGLALERKRLFDKAEAVYQLLNGQGGHSDSKSRIKHLKQVSAPTLDLPNMQQTLVLDNTQLQLPQLGRYNIVREIGRGSMGVVYLAKDPKIDRDVAIKTVNLRDLDAGEIESVKNRFFKEAQAAGKLNHPNIVTVYDVGEEKDVAYIAMDFVKGHPMNEYSRSGQLLDFKEILEIAAQVADALKLAHEHDIVHRDIKPSNILYNKETGTVKVSDFGIARIADSKQTQTGIVMGSPSFMSPEQIRGEKLTGQSDIFSLGVSLYQLLTGELPFKGENLPGLAYSITHDKQKSVREYNNELPQSVIRIVNKALQKDSVKRFADAGIMADTLNKVAKKARADALKS